VYATYELCRYDCPHSENDEKTNISYSSACIAVLLLQPDKRAYTDDDKIIWISNELEENCLWSMKGMERDDYTRRLMGNNSVSLFTTTVACNQTVQCFMM